jgi:hypothetical protein
MDYKNKASADRLTPDPNIVVSGIDELRHMEEHLMEPNKLYG